MTEINPILHQRLSVPGILRGMRFQSVDVEDGVMELKIRSDSKAPLDKLTECEVAINVVNKNLSFGSTYVDDGGMIRFRYPYIFFDAFPPSV